MLYSEVKDGETFCIDGTRSYPKRKEGVGHLDLRDNLRNAHGSPDWEVEIMSADEVKRALEQ